MSDGAHDEPGRGSLIALLLVVAVLVAAGGGFWFWRSSERAKARAELAAELERAMRHATGIRDDARTLGVDSAAVERFAAAIRAARIAMTLADRPDASREQRARVLRLLQDTERERDEVRAELTRIAEANQLVERIRNALVPTEWMLPPAKSVLSSTEIAGRKLGDDPDGAIAKRLLGGASAARLLRDEHANDGAIFLDDRALHASETEPLEDMLRASAGLVAADALRSRLHAALLDRGQDRRHLLRIAGEARPSHHVTTCVLAAAILEGRSAERLLAAVQRDRPHDFHVNVRLGQLREELRLAEARACYERALAASPRTHRIRVRLANVLSRLGDHVAAVEQLQQLLRYEPREPRWRVRLAEAYRDAGNLGAAISAYREVLRSKPEWEMVRPRLATALVANGEPAEATRVYRGAIARDKKNAALRHEMGLVLHAMKRFEGADAAYRQAIALEPGRMDAHADLGRVLLDKGEPAGAEKVLRAALERDAEHARCWHGLGNVLAVRGDHAGASDAQRRATDLDAGYAEAWCARGALARERGRYVDALAFYEKGHELGTKRGAEWSLPSDEWLEKARTQAKIERRLLPIVEGKAQAIGAAEWLDVSDYAFVRQDWAACVRAYAAAERLAPDLVTRLVGTQREHAAFAAARAGRHDEALRWLRLEFERWRKDATGGPEVLKRRAIKVMRRWFVAGELAPVRGKALEKLPEKDARAWQSFWSMVDSIAEPVRK